MNTIVARLESDIYKCGDKYAVSVVLAEGSPSMEDYCKRFSAEAKPGPDGKVEFVGSLNSIISVYASHFGDDRCHDVLLSDVSSAIARKGV